MVLVGIPRSLAYWSYYPLWKTFFEQLGARVVVSRASSKATLDAGVREAVSDACVPIKLYHGHVLDLRDRVDFLFIPRLVSVGGSYVFCPKFLGLPDMIRYSLSSLPPIIDVRVDLRRGCGELWRVCKKVGEMFTDNVRQVAVAYWRALWQQRRFLSLMQRGFPPPEAMEIMEGKQHPRASPGVVSLRFAVLGYPYAIFDEYISINLVKKLRSMGASVVTTEMLPERALARQRRRLSKDLFWLFSSRALRAAYHLFETREVDGIIHVTAFSCGPDSMVDKLMELEARRKRTVPFLSLMIDEHTGESGLDTRLEAFVDLVRRKKGVWA